MTLIYLSFLLTFPGLWGFFGFFFFQLVKVKVVEVNRRWWAVLGGRSLETALPYLPSTPNTRVWALLSQTANNTHGQLDATVPEAPLESWQRNEG